MRAILALFAFAIPALADYSWTELGPNQSLLARTIVTSSDAPCPPVFIDGTPSTMTPRASRSAEFPVLVCEAVLPAATTKATIAGQPLALPKPHLHRVVIIGDTGCRIVDGSGGKRPRIQNCEDATVWPFMSIAQKAAQAKPDLIVHVGDYLYRETACPADMPCKGTPFGHTWQGWEADFFRPANPLLSAAPWIFVRGNHEDCNRAWQGWFLFLNPAAIPAACEIHSPPYSVKTGGSEFVVVDSASAADDSPKPASIAAYQKDFEQIAAMKLVNAILVTHRPMWGVKEPAAGKKGFAIIDGSLSAAWHKVQTRASAPSSPGIRTPPGSELF